MESLRQRRSLATQNAEGSDEAILSKQTGRPPVVRATVPPQAFGAMVALLFQVANEWRDTSAKGQ